MEDKKEKVKLIEHEFIPKHELISEEEAQALLDKYSIVKMQLPKILKNDPAIAHLEINRGDVIKITRSSKTARRAIYYRVVV